VSGKPPITIDASGLDQLGRGLDRIERSLRDESGGRLGSAASSSVATLARELRASAAHSRTPQARIVADAITIGRGQLAIGGGEGVGSRGTAAGVLVWGSEHGGEHFGAARGGSYWIAPAVERVRGGSAPRIYEAAVAGILRDGGL
jgi:hypothetical protein